MTSPQIKVLISLAAVSIVYAFLCRIRLSRKISELKSWLRKEHPEFGSELDKLAKNWSGGLGGLKILYRRNTIYLPNFTIQFEKLLRIERKLLWGICIGSVCIGLVIIGFKYWGWYL